MQRSFPSVRTLQRINLGGIEGRKLDKNSARLVRTVMRARNQDALMTIPAYEQVREDFLRNYDLWYLKMKMLDVIIQGHGVEFADLRTGSVAYVNFGRTYDTTICYFQGRFMVWNWGDIYEKYGDMSQ